MVERRIRVNPDRSRIDLDAAPQVRHWTKKWAVSRDEIQRAIAKVGPTVKAVEKELGKTPPQELGKSPAQDLGKSPPQDPRADQAQPSLETN